MDRLNQLSAVWAEAMIRVCWQSALFAIATWVLCRARRRMPIGVMAALWTIVCLKFVVGLVPFAIALPIMPAAPTTVGSSRRFSN
jgi:hypothetical protein